MKRFPVVFVFESLYVAVTVTSIVQLLRACHSDVPRTTRDCWPSVSEAGEGVPTTGVGHSGALDLQIIRAAIGQVVGEVDAADGGRARIGDREGQRGGPAGCDRLGRKGLVDGGVDDVGDAAVEAEKSEL